MKRIGMGLVGPGFVGMHHIDAVRRLGFVDVVAIADVDEALAREKASALGIRKAYGSFDALAADPDVDVIHNTTPNHLHGAVIRAALAHRKHIVSEKPLASSASEAGALWSEAVDAGVVHAVTFNYRGNPLVQQARAMVARGDIGSVHFVHGGYLQDWLLKPTDYSWRLEPDLGGASSAFADIGSHWCDLAQHVTGSAIVEVMADLATVVPTRYRPVRSPQAFAKGGNDARESFRVKSEDLATILVRFENGARGCATRAAAGACRRACGAAARACRAATGARGTSGATASACCRARGAASGARGSIRPAVPCRAGRPTVTGRPAPCRISISSATDGAREEEGKCSQGQLARSGHEIPPPRGQVVHVRTEPYF